MLYDETERAIFLEMDLPLLRCTHITVEVAPPAADASLHYPDNADDDQFAEDQCFVCVEKLVDGTVCGCTFFSKRALSAHKMKASEVGGYARNGHACFICAVKSVYLVPNRLCRFGSRKKSCRCIVQTWGVPCQ